VISKKDWLKIALLLKLVRKTASKNLPEVIFDLNINLIVLRIFVLGRVADNLYCAIYGFQSQSFPLQFHNILECVCSVLLYFLM